MHWAVVVLIVVLALGVVWLSVCLALALHHIGSTERTLKESSVVQPLLHTLRQEANEAPAPTLVPLVAAIVEPRDHPNLHPVLDNVRDKLGTDVPVYVFHGPATAAALAARADPHLVAVPLGVDNLTIRQYNLILTEPAFWERLHGEHVLVFQTDSVLFTQSPVKLDEFMEYDYVGAPWRGMGTYYVRNFMMFRNLDAHMWAGNGGLSLRRRSTMLRVTREVPYLSIPYPSEDVYFSVALHRLEGDTPAHLPTSDVAARFSYEHVASDVLPWGAHQHLPPKFRHLITLKEEAILADRGS